MSPAIELIGVILLPTALGYSLLGSVRLVPLGRGTAQDGPVPHAGTMTAEPIERLGARMRRLRAELEALETRTDVQAKGVRLRALRGAYLDLLRVACERLDVSPLPPGRPWFRRPRSTGSRPALRRSGLDVRETASR